MSIISLRDYQIDAVNFILEKKRCFLSIACGGGKTVTSLEAIRRSGAKSVLIVSTPMCVQTEWRRHKSPNITITTYGCLKKLNGREFDFILLDESTKVKNNSTQAFKLMCKISKNSKYLVLATATPLGSGDPKDLWAQTYLIDRGERLGRYISHFVSENYYAVNPLKGIFKIKSQEHVEAVLEKVKDLIFFTSKSVDLVFKHKTLDVPLSKEQIGLIAQMKISGVASVDGNVVVARSAGEKIAKVRQLSSGFVLKCNRSPVYLHHNPKLEEIKRILSDGKPTLVAYTFVAEREMLMSIGGIVVSPKNVDLWNSGEIKFMIMSVAAASHGLNLQYGGSRIIWMCSTGSHERFLQMNSRLLRIGQESDVEVIALRTKHDATLENSVARTGKIYESLKS